MEKPKGGRGHTAPYDTKQMRIPVGLESQIQELMSRYRKWISDSGSGVIGANNPPNLLNKPVDNLDEVNKLKSQLAAMEERCQELEEKVKAVDKLQEKVIGYLQEALKLKANAGGAIKEKIREAMKLLED